MAVQENKSCLKNAFSKCESCGQPELVIEVQRNQEDSFLKCDKHVRTCEENEEAENERLHIKKLVNELVLSQERYCSNGCGTFDTIRELQDHGLKCVNRDNISLCFIGDCQYNGSNICLIQHVCDTHPEKLIILEDNFRENIQIGFSHPVVLMLRFEIGYPSNQLFWMRLHEDQDQRFIMIQYLGRCGYDVGGFENWQLLLKSQRFHLELDISKQVIESRDKNALDDIMRNHGTEITMLPDKEYGLQIRRKDQVILPSKMLQAMECIVCHEVMCSPVMMCSTGHSICKTCRDKLIQCPLCNDEYNNGRNYALEATLSQLPKRCKNAQNGCKEQMLQCESESHAKVCFFRSVKCPFGCESAEILLKDFPDHYRDNHKIYMKANGAEYTLTIKSCWYPIMIHEFGNIFIINLMFRDHCLIPSANHFATDGSNFIVELALYNSTGGDEAALTMRLPCSKVVNKCNVNDERFQISKEMIKYITSGGPTIDYALTVTKMK